LPIVPSGSVLIAITGQGKTRGTAAILGIEATINQHVAYITPQIPVVGSEYLHLALSAAYQTLRALSEDSGSTKGALTCADLKRFKVALPPMQEQSCLVRFVRNETLTLEAIRARTDREIELLREYRTTLTAEVVTGKLDVREAAMRLPDQADESLPPDESLDDPLDDEIAEEVEA
jgi:type I restriction enzyme, S subunit